MSEDLTAARQFELWAGSLMGAYVPAPTTPIAAVFPPSSRASRIATQAMAAADAAFEAELLDELGRGEGDVCLFGDVLLADLIRLGAALNQAGHAGRVYAYDLFNDADGDLRSSELRAWIPGQPRVELIPGWYAESFEKAASQRIGAVSFARLRFSHAEPCRDCLDFLTERLVDGAVVKIERIGFDLQVGALSALAAWISSLDGRRRFEFLGLGQGHALYLRVHHG